jgi:hypothetical protein
MNLFYIKFEDESIYDMFDSYGKKEFGHRTLEGAIIEAEALKGGEGCEIYDIFDTNLNVVYSNRSEKC